MRAYGHGRLEHQALPTLRGDDLWTHHPLVASAIGPDLQKRLLAAADAPPDYMASWTLRISAALMVTRAPAICS